jgi:hypothetical protein
VPELPLQVDDGANWVRIAVDPAGLVLAVGHEQQAVLGQFADVGERHGRQDRLNVGHQRPLEPGDLAAVVNDVADGISDGALAGCRLRLHVLTLFVDPIGWGLSRGRWRIRSRTAPSGQAAPPPKVEDGQVRPRPRPGRFRE